MPALPLVRMVEMRMIVDDNSWPTLLAIHGELEASKQGRADALRERV